MNPYSHIMTNRDKDVFIPLVPSVLGAMLMSKVSRQKEGFREDLIHMVEADLVNLPTQNQYELFKNSVVVANGFMEKWGVNYGHSSIKELDTLQMCIENRSRWFTEILETVQPYKFMSYIEYSLRYNPPTDFYVPVELKEDPSLEAEYLEFSRARFADYHDLKERFAALFRVKYPELTETQVELKAFENARNVLPLSTKANMGMQSNLRAFCNALSEMNAYQDLNAEIADTAALMKEEAEVVSVGMVRHVEASEYQRAFVRAYYQRENLPAAYPVYLTPQTKAISGVIGDPTTIERTGDLSLMNRFDELPHTFRNIGKRFEVLMSEGAHHQFIRHRAFDIHTKLPDVRFGMLMPEEVAAPGFEALTEPIAAVLRAAYSASCDLYERLWGAGFTALVPYVVLNCNMRKVDFFGNLYGMAHFLTLRKEKHAQDEIRTVAGALHDELRDIEALFPGLNLDKNEGNA